MALVKSIRQCRNCQKVFRYNGQEQHENCRPCATKLKKAKRGE